MDPEVKKTVLRLFTYGLHAVTTRGEGGVHGMTADWLAQSSFEPPMLMLAVENESLTLRLIRANGHFAVNVYGAEQRELAGQLGRKSAKMPNKMEGVAWRLSSRKNPILDDTLGYLECEVRGEVPSGDHTVLVAEIVDAGLQREADPLTMKSTGFKYFG